MFRALLLCLERYFYVQSVTFMFRALFLCLERYFYVSLILVETATV